MFRLIDPLAQANPAETSIGRPEVDRSQHYARTFHQLN
jgi:hypothetical protein